MARKTDLSELQKKKHRYKELYIGIPFCFKSYFPLHRDAWKLVVSSTEKAQNKH